MASLFPGIRRAAPRLSRDLFSCRQCLPQAASGAAWQLPCRNPSIGNIRYNSTGTATTNTPLGSLARVLGQAPMLRNSKHKELTTRPSASGFFPPSSSKSVAYWLLASAGSVFGIVVFGGLTRLTESGLSITEWKPVTGSLPPLSNEDWQSEFDKYRASPEFKLLNPYMNIDEFKKIYFMEWTHRLWGRFIGLSFVLPAIYFVARRKVSANMTLRLLGISGLIGVQGAIGWWMVKSGLKDDLFAPGSHPRVSQYRLTTHLGAAIICYSAMLWNGLSILQSRRFITKPHEALQLASPTLSIFRKSVAGLAILVFVTAMSGGLVAGLDAGMIYNQFPRMGEGFAPPKSELFSKFYSRKEDGSDIWWRNMLENPSTVQLDHRILAMTTFTTILSLFAYARFNPKVRGALPRNAQKAMLGVVHLVLLQATLGISTLIYLVPTPLAAAHQAGALALLTGVLVLRSRTFVPKRALRTVRENMKLIAQKQAMNNAKERATLGNAAHLKDIVNVRRVE